MNGAICIKSQNAARDKSFIHGDCHVNRGTMRSTSCLGASRAIFRPLFAFCAFSAFFAYAEPVQDLGSTEIIEPPLTPAEVAPSYEEILPSAWEGRGIDAVEVLSSLPGIQSYRQGGMGSFQTVSIRGVAARNILICVDGVPLNDAGGGAADLGSIDLNNVEKIEIYKDRVPARFGGSGLGGAINFVTKSTLQNGGKLGGRVLAGVGSHNVFEGSAQVTATPADSVQFSATASMRHSDNDYEFKNRNGTAYNTEDDFTDKRHNAEFSEYSGNVQYRMLHAGGYFSTVSASVIRTEAGNPGREESQTYVADFVGESVQLGYRLETPVFLDFMLLEAGISGKFEKNVSSSYYPLDHIGYVSSDYLEYGLAGYRLIPELIGTFVFENFEAMLRLAASAERFEARGTIHEFGLERIGTSVAANAEYAFTNWFSILAEGNVLKNVDEIDGGNLAMPTGTTNISDASERDLSMGGMVQAKLGKKDSWFGGNVSIGRFYRQPQLMELYGVYQGVLSNPKLKEEEAVKFEAGIFIATPRNVSVLRATYFESHIENGIFWVTSANMMKAFNANEALVRGVELELVSHPASIFETVLRATLQDPRDTGNNKTYNGMLLPGEPVQSYFAEGKIYLPLHFDITLSSDYRTRIFSDRANRTRQPAVAHFNSALGYNPWSKTRLVFSVNNITDETYTNIYSPYPRPGREYRFTLTQGL